MGEVSPGVIAKRTYSPTCDTGMCSGQGQSRGLGHLQAHHLALGAASGFHRGWPCQEHDLAP